MYQTIHQDGSYVVVGLSMRQAVEEKHGEIIFDVNERGNWVHGFEMVGGFVDFSVEKAVRPFKPKRPNFSEVHPRTAFVTYDPDADAAFVYLNYTQSATKVPDDVWAELMTVSQGVNPSALYGLDADGGLVWVKIPIADVIGSLGQFLELVRTD